MNTPRNNLKAKPTVLILTFSLFATVALLCATESPATAANAPATASARLPVPDNAALARKEKVIRDVFGNYTAGSAAERAAAAAKMVDQAEATADDPVARYLLLKDASDLAAGTGDAVTSIKAATLLSNSYAVDGGELKLLLLRKCLTNSSSAAAAKATADTGFAAANEAGAQGNFDLAVKMISSTETAARNAKNITLLMTIQARAGELRWMQQEGAKAKIADEKLAKNPADAEANLARGRYLCLIRGDWAGGLAALAKGSNPGLKEAADADLANSAHSNRQMAAGDLWWNLAEKEAAGAQGPMRRRATYWYSRALADSAVNGLKRTLLQKRIDDFPPPAEMLAGVNSPATAPAVSASTQTPAAPAVSAAGTVDLLKQLKLPGDIVEGVWERTADGVTNAGDGRGARLKFPYNPPAEYDLHVVFTPHEERSSWGVLLAHGEASGMWKIDNCAQCRFRGAGDRAHMLPEHVANIDPKLSVGTKHEVLIRVRNDSISTFIDGKAMGQITEDYSQCRLEGYWSIGSRAIGIGNGNSAVTFHNVEVTPAKESAEPTPSSAPKPTVAADDRHGKIVNLLPLIDVKRDRRAGNWQADASGLACDNKEGALLAIPSTPSEEYNLHVAFTKQDPGVGNTQIMFGKADHRVALILFQDKPLCYGLGGMDGKAWWNNPSSGKGDTQLSGRRHDCTLQVRRDSLACVIDGKQVFGFKTDYTNLGEVGWWSVKPNLFGVGSNKAATVFHVIEVEELTTSPDGGKPVVQLPSDLGKILRHPAKITSTTYEPQPLVASDDPKHGFGSVPPVFTAHPAVIYAVPTSKELGVAEFEVTESGYLLLACHFGKQGNRSGDWLATRLTQDGFLQRGWQIVADDTLGGNLTSTAGSRQQVIFQKHVEKGEKYSLRCNKYDPPFAIVFSSASGNQAEASPQKPPAPKTLAGPPLFAGSSPGDNNVMLFEGDGVQREKALFTNVGGNVVVAKAAEAAVMLANPDTWSKSHTIVFGVNRLCNAPPTDITPAARESLHHFVENGGDLVLFEQGRRNNWDVIENTFGIKSRGGPFHGATATSLDLIARLQAAGLNDDAVKKATFYNAYTLPQNATVLLRSGSGADASIILAAVAPVGKGRVILIGAHVDAATESLDQVILSSLYHDARPAGSKTPAKPDNPGIGNSIFGK